MEHRTALSKTFCLTLLLLSPVDFFPARAQQTNPVIVSVSTRGNPNAVYLTFNTNVLTDGMYNISNTMDGTVIAATSTVGATATEITLVPASVLAADIGYILIAQGIQDTFGQFIFPDPTHFHFVHGAEYPSFCIYYERYDDVGDGILDAFLASPKYLNNEPDLVRTDFDLLESPNNQRDNFGDRLAGFYVAQRNAIYQFWISTDEQGAGYIATDANPAHKVQICAEPTWGFVRGWTGYESDGNNPRGTPPIYDPPSNTTGNGSVGIPLTAGQVVYLEVLHTDGGGGDNSAMTVTVGDFATSTPPPNGAPPIACADLRRSRVAPDRTFFVTLGPVVLLQQPTNQWNHVGETATFSIGLDGTPPYSIQWLRNGTPIAGANASTYTTLPAVVTDDVATYAVSVSNEFSSVISSNAFLRIAPNLQIVSVSTRGNPNAVYVTYNTNVLTDGTYSISQGINATTVNGVAYGTSQREIVLATAALISDVTNTLTVLNVHALSNNALDPNPTVVDFQHGAEFPSFRILYKRYNEPHCDPFACPPGYATNFPPTDIRYLSDFEAPGNVAEQYTAILFGFFVAPQDGDYRFWMSSDSSGATYLATDSVPAHRIQICAEPAWSQARGFADAGHDLNDGRGSPPIYDPTGSGNTTGNGSLPIPLTAGQIVYLEGVFVAGSVAGNYACTVTLNETNAPANGTEPISATNFMAMRIATNGQVFSTLGTVFLSRQPVDQTVYPGQAARFSVLTDGTPPYSVQWFRNGNPIAGATGTDYTTPLATPADGGTVYSVTVSNAFSSAVSTNAALRIQQEPVIAVTLNGQRTLVIEWTDPTLKLQRTTNLGPNVIWQDVQGVQSPYPLPNPRTGNQFYRMISP